MKQLIKNCRLAPDSPITAIHIKDGVIDAIKCEEEAADTIYDAKGLVAVPGLVDMNCSICDPGYEFKEDFDSIADAACAAGYTTITSSPATMPVADNKTVIHYVISQARAKKKVRIIPYGSMTKGGEGKAIAEIGEMKYAGIGAVSDGGRTIADSSLLRMILLYSKMFDVPVITSCEDAMLVKGGVMNEGMLSTQIGLKGIPREAEEVIVSRNLILAEHTKSRLHIASVSTKGSVSLIRDAKKRGVQVTCDTCPHYFSLTEDILASYHTFAKTRPPLRTQSDIDAIINGLVDGTIDVIASGHSPTIVEMKLKEFDDADYGISSLETALPVSYMALVDTGILTLSQLLDRMSFNPATILGLKNTGKIECGFVGEIALVDFKTPYHIKGAHFHSKAKFTPYEGLKVLGKVNHVVCSGHTDHEINNDMIKQR